MSDNVYRLQINVYRLPINVYRLTFTDYRLPIKEKEAVLDGTASFVFCQHELKHEPLGRWP